MARQVGINNTKNPYLMFIDAGDIFVSREVQKDIPKRAQQFDYSNMIVWPYYYNNELTPQSDNRMHGKLYKRSFLEKFHITFCPEGSYINEDIGFNRACRIITRAYREPIVFMNEPALLYWVKDENSLSQRDNNAMRYRQQTFGLAMNSIHCIETLRENGLDLSAIDEIHQIAAAMYYWYIQTVANRPEYKEEAFCGAKIFYKKFAKEINKDSLALSPEHLMECVKLRSEGKLPFAINIKKFYNDIMGGVSK